MSTQGLGSSQKAHTRLLEQYARYLVSFLLIGHKDLLCLLYDQLTVNLSCIKRLLPYLDGCNACLEQTHEALSAECRLDDSAPQKGATSSDQSALLMPSSPLALQSSS